MDISVHDSAGIILVSYDLPDGETPEVPVGGNTIAGAYDPDLIYVVAGAPVARPVLVETTTVTVPRTNVATTIATVPAGTVVHDISNDVTLTAATTEDVQVAAQVAGTFPFRIFPPTPYVIQTITVNVDVI